MNWHKVRILLQFDLNKLIVFAQKRAHVVVDVFVSRASSLSANLAKDMRNTVSQLHLRLFITERKIDVY